MIPNDIFLSQLSIRPQCLRLLQIMTGRNRSSFRAWGCLNKKFPSKFLFTVDPRYQIWLKQCRTAINHSHIDSSIIDFSSLSPMSYLAHSTSPSPQLSQWKHLRQQQQPVEGLTAAPLVEMMMENIKRRKPSRCKTSPRTLHFPLRNVTYQFF